MGNFESHCPSEPEPVEVRFDDRVSKVLRSRGGSLGPVYVWAEIDDRLAGRFLLDTESTRNSLNLESAQELGIALTRHGRIGGVGGSTTAYRATARTLEVGPLTLGTPEFIVAEMDSAKYDHRLGIFCAHGPAGRLGVPPL